MDGLLVLRSSNIQNSKLDFNDNVFVKNNVVPEKIKTKLNDVLMCVRNGSRNLVGKTALITNGYENLAWGAFMNILRPLENNNYLYYFLNSEIFKKQIYKDLATATVNQITMQTLNGIKLFLPSIKEQEKIAEFLSLVDERIEKQRLLVENLKKYKRGLFNKVFKSISGDYITLDKILIEVNEKSKINNEYPIISSTKQGLFLQSEYFNKQAASENTVGYKILRKGQIVFSPQNLWMGNINYNFDFEKGIVSPSYKTYKIAEEFNPYFIGVLLKEPVALKEYMLASEQGASIVRRNLNMELFNSIKFKIPKIEIQNKLAKILQKTNILLDKEEQYLNELNKYKNGLLQQMFI